MWNAFYLALNVVVNTLKYTPLRILGEIARECQFCSTTAKSLVNSLNFRISSVQNETCRDAADARASVPQRRAEVGRSARAQSSRRSEEVQGRLGECASLAADVTHVSF